MKIVWFTLICLVLSKAASKSISFKFEVEKYDKSNLQSFSEITSKVTGNEQRIITNLTIGAKHQQFPVLVSIDSILTWVPDIKNPQDLVKLDSSNLSVIGNNMNFTYEDGKYVSGNTVSTSLYAPVELEDLGLLSAIDSHSFPGLGGMIGLGYPLRNEETPSIIEQLLYGGKISHRAISIDIVEGEGGVLQIGEVPDNLLKDYQHYGTCTLTTFYPKETVDFYRYNCEPDSMVFGTLEKNQEIAVKPTISFSLSFKKSIVPFNYVDILAKTYFGEEIKNKNCGYETRNNYKIFSCKSIENLKDIFFLFKDHAMRIPKDKLFTFNKQTSSYDFDFYVGISKDPDERLGPHDISELVIVIGYDMMQNFKMVFDSTDLKVGFYSVENTIFLGKNKPETHPNVDSNPDEQNPKKKINLPETKPIISPPTEIDPSKMDIPIKSIRPEEKENPLRKVVITIGIAILIGLFLCIGLMTLRYFRLRRKSEKESRYKTIGDEQPDYGIQMKNV